MHNVATTATADSKDSATFETTYHKSTIDLRWAFLVSEITRTDDFVIVKKTYVPAYVMTCII